MTKSEIVHAVYHRVGGFSKKEAADIVELVFEMVKETLGRGEKIKISGFGNFVLRDKRKRRGRNPQTGAPLTITERRVLTFKPSQILKSTLNGDEEGADAAPESRRDDAARTRPASDSATASRDARSGNGNGTRTSTGAASAYVDRTARAASAQSERR